MHGDDEMMATEHPKKAAESVSRLVTEITGFMSAYGELSRRPTEVGPQPCELVEKTLPVADPMANEVNPFRDPWFIDYSPYTMMWIGYVDCRSVNHFGTVAAPLRDHLTGLGWRAHEAVLDPESGGEARLVIESPIPGYGARIVGVPRDSGMLRVAVFASSPCLRHPSASS
jgi:hypothetical protein